MRLTLSFDNGPDPDVTPRVLDVLDRRGVRAQFWVLGKHVATTAGRACVERAHAAGHVVGNHSYSHETPLGDDPRPDAAAREIGAAQDLLEPLVGAARRFRPFGGGGVLGPHLFSRAAVELLRDGGYTCVLWNSVPRDWEDPTRWPARALAELAVRAHTLVVLHDIAGACLPELDAFLDEVAARGVELTTDDPPDCTPLVAGRITGEPPLGPLVRGGYA
ncbi:MAG: polysaccharide deacetylase family protein [Deltaproteobacteria bacterium]|nr:polysaccharide deacetylase family protein [Deltaproteobacteria bacterium]